MLPLAGIADLNHSRDRCVNFLQGDGPRSPPHLPAFCSCIGPPLFPSAGIIFLSYYIYSYISNFYFSSIVK